jgi:outer membrane protein OmpA-like peptidoglycan-associated protein
MAIPIGHMGANPQATEKKPSLPADGPLGKQHGGGRNGTMNVYRVASLGLTVALALAGATGCATKNYVRNQTAPLVDRTNQLDEKTAANNRQIHDVDDRAQAGIKQAQDAADRAAQNAQNASKAAGDAETAANNAVHRADSLDSVIKGLDNYRPLANVAVTFGFDKAVLSKGDCEQLDTFAAQLGSAKSYILEVTGGTDSTGPAQYNYDLSQRRADAVVQYLAAKYGIAAHRFYLIGIGKDKAVAPNTTAEGRKQNRRVEVRMLSNASEVSVAAAGER